MTAAWRLTKREQKAQEELRTAVAALETAHAVLSRVAASQPSPGSRPFTIHLWTWAMTGKLMVSTVIQQLREAAYKTPEQLGREREEQARALLSR